MAPATPPLIVHVFLASPGDVPEERAFVRDYLELSPPNDAILESRARFEVVKLGSSARRPRRCPRISPHRKR